MEIHVQTGRPEGADLLVGMQLRLQDGDDEGSFREGVVTRVCPAAGGRERIVMAVRRRVIDDIELLRFERVWEFDSDVPMSQVEVDWNDRGLSKRVAAEVALEPVAAIA